MDIVLLPSAAYELPTSRRVGVIVHDGTTDLRVFRGPGADRELAFAYGPETLDRLLETERGRAGGAVPVGTTVRLHAGKLHCDFLLWVATRGPESAGVQAPAPDEATLRASVQAALEFVVPRHVHRVAFSNLGAGPKAIDDAQRLAVIVRAANAFYEERLAKGLPNPIEEVLVCDGRMSVVAQARKLVASLAKAPSPEKPLPGVVPEKPAKARETKPKAAASAPARKARLTESEIGAARARGQTWDRATVYAPGSYFIHSKFGVGRVEEVTTDQFIVVLFEDGETRRLIHAV